MPNFAIHDGSTVQNVIVADSQEIAEEVTGLQAMPAPEDGRPWIGWTMEEEGWREPSPFPSWLWDKKSKSWVAPIPYPEGGNGYTWYEETVSWVEIPPMEPAPPAQ